MSVVSVLLDHLKISLDHVICMVSGAIPYWALDVSFRRQRERSKEACPVFWPVPPIQLNDVAPLLPSLTLRPRSLHLLRRSPALVPPSAVTLAILVSPSSSTRRFQLVGKTPGTAAVTKTNRVIRGSKVWKNNGFWQFLRNLLPSSDSTMLRRRKRVDYCWVPGNRG